MSNLLFERLTLLSDSDKSANQFEFKKHLNLITGIDNSIGKSTLAKMLLWAIGCEPAFDTTWKAMDCKAVLEFSIGDDSYQVARYGNSINLYKNKNIVKFYPKITGDYSLDFSRLVQFSALLPNRDDSNKLETPPPSFYFLPFYVDQRKSWSHAWVCFQNLGQYSSWQQTIVKYHTGYLKTEHFELEKIISEAKSNKKELDDDVQKIEAAIEVIARYTPNFDGVLAISSEEFDFLSHQVDAELAELQKDQEKTLGMMANLQIELQHLVFQQKMLSAAAEALEADYVFAVERISGDELYCPLCGTIHDNSLASRSVILADKEEALQQGRLISTKTKKLKLEIERVRNSLQIIREKISLINEKYSDYDAPHQADDFSFMDKLAPRVVEKNIGKNKQNKQILSIEISKTIKARRKLQKSFLSETDKNALDANFMGHLTKYIEILNAKGINLSEVTSPLDYKKLYDSGGAAESTRGIFAYQMATLKQIDSTNNEVLAPFIIDTPNQHEQTGLNYEKIIELLISEIPSSMQLILCAMDSDAIKKYSLLAHEVRLDEDRVLSKTKYEKFRPIVTAYFQTKDVQEESRQTSFDFDKNSE